ncbi:hypothetical protein IMZ48_33060, partial [Candidatus Bathyarchaeota archaeon]|nr:hypothetical protein [Candidatus Bathyarchaeota archaeon]
MTTADDANDEAQAQPPMPPAGNGKTAPKPTVGPTNDAKVKPEPLSPDDDANPGAQPPVAPAGNAKAGPKSATGPVVGFKSSPFLPEDANNPWAHPPMRPVDDANNPWAQRVLGAISGPMSWQAPRPRAGPTTSKSATDPYSNEPAPQLAPILPPSPRQCTKCREVRPGDFFTRSWRPHQKLAKTFVECNLCTWESKGLTEREFDELFRNPEPALEVHSTLFAPFRRCAACGVRRHFRDYLRTLCPQVPAARRKACCNVCCLRTGVLGDEKIVEYRRESAEYSVKPEDTERGCIA